RVALDLRARRADRARQEGTLELQRAHRGRTGGERVRRVAGLVEARVGVVLRGQLDPAVDVELLATDDVVDLFATGEQARLVRRVVLAVDAGLDLVITGGLHALRDAHA